MSYAAKTFVLVPGTDAAMVPLLVAEPGSPAARQLWDRAARVASVRLVYPEARAALAQAHRNQRLTARQLRRTVQALDDRRQLDLVKFDETLAQYAGDLAESDGVRGYDAVHLAAAHRLVRDLKRGVRTHSAMAYICCSRPSTW
jgi:uncharacterized protein